MNIHFTTQFKKDYKRIKKQGKDPGQLKVVIEKLVAGEKLEPKYRDHQLSGHWKGHRDCHIESDWILIYRIEDEDLLTVKRVARDTAIPKRQKVVEALIKLNCSAANSIIAATSGLNFKTVIQEVERMDSLNIVTSNTDRDGGTCCFTNDFQKISDVVNGEKESEII